MSLRISWSSTHKKKFRLFSGDHARIDVRAGKIHFPIGRRNMTFKFQANEEQCYLVQDEEARGWRKPRSQYKKEKVAPTKPKVDSLITMMRKHWEQDKAFNGRRQPKKSKAINKAKGEKKTEIKNTPAKGSPTSSPPKRTKKVWRVKRASSESSTPGRTSPILIEQPEESRSRTLNDEPSPRGKPVFISYFPSNLLFHASIMFRFQICFHHCI
jgi:hypothetical protein